MSASLQQASIIKRLASLVYDSLIVIAISFTYGWSVLMLKYKFLGMELGENGRAQLSGFESLLLLLVIIFFYSFFWHRGGQTLGMKAWRLKLLNSEGERPSWGQCMLRAVIALPLFPIGYLWKLIDREDKCLQDKFSGTQIVVLKKK